MYTNWPFTAKTNTHTIHMSEFCQRRFFFFFFFYRDSTSAQRVKRICSHTRYVKVKSPREGKSLAPRH